MSGLPTNPDAERFVLGAILLDQEFYSAAAGVLVPDDFSLEKHRRIWKRMGELHERRERIDRVTVINELMRFSELESCDGMAYVNSLDDGIPVVSSIDGYIRIVKEKANLRRIVFAAQHLMNRAMLGQEGAAEIQQGALKTFRDVYMEPEAGRAEDVPGIIREAGGIQKFLQPSYGIPSPWRMFNHATGGWQKGELILLAARPSMGKTALALNAIWEAACRGVSSVFYTYEMSRESIIKRLISLLARVTYTDLQRDELNSSERRAVAEALELIQEKPILIVQAAGKSVLALRSHAERAKREGKLQFAAIDYIGLIHASDRQQNRNQELGEICRQLKELAGELDVPLLVLSQLSRAPETRTDKRPVQSDLRDSGELENHADLIGFLHRRGYYDREDLSLRTHAELIIAKQRNGDTPIVKLEFHREYGHFVEPSAEDQRRFA